MAKSSMRRLWLLLSINNARVFCWPSFEALAKAHASRVKMSAAWAKSVVNCSDLNYS